MALWNVNCLLQCGRRHRLCFYQKYFDSCEWWYLNYKCFSISFDDEDIYGDNGNAFDDDGDNDNEDAFFDTIFVTLNIVNLIAGIQSNHNLCINSTIFIVTFSPSFDWHLLEEWLVDLNWDLRMETFSCRPAEMKGKCINIHLFSLKFNLNINRCRIHYP